MRVNKTINSFLVINPFGIGDVLFSTPLLRNLKRAYPEAKIYYLCNRRTASFLKQHPLIEDVFIYQQSEFASIRKRSLVAWLRRFRGFIKQIRDKKIEVAIDLSLNSEYGFFAMLAGIKRRFGLNYKKRGYFLKKKIKLDGFDDKHVVEYYLDVLKLLDIKRKQYNLEVYTDQESKDLADKFIEKHNLDDKLIIGIAPCGGQAFGPNADRKRWPPEYFAQLIKRLIQDLGAKIFLFAGPDEKEDIKHIKGLLGDYRRDCYQFTDASLLELIAFVDKCNLIIANDTGPLRFADAMNKKIIALFGPVDEVVYGPYPPGAQRVKVLAVENLPCRPCYRRFRLDECKRNKQCLRDIDSLTVFNEVKQLLQK